MANHVRPIVVSEADRAELERRASPTPAGWSRRARAVLLMAQELSGVEVADGLVDALCGEHGAPAMSANDTLSALRSRRCRSRVRPWRRGRPRPARRHP